MQLCDSDGCCRAKTSATTTTSEPTTTTTTTTEPPVTTTTNTVTQTDVHSTVTTASVPSKPASDSTATITATSKSTTEPTTVTVTLDHETTVTSVSPTTIKPSKKHTCEGPGYFVDKANPRFYYHCKFFAAIHSCGSDEKFDVAQSHCVYDQSEEPALAFSKWKHAVHCSKFGTYLRSPFDCKYFYLCEPNGDSKYRIYFNYCFDGLVFNETTQSCDFKTKRCNNQLVLPADDKKLRL